MTVEEAYDVLFRNGHFPLLVITKDGFIEDLKEQGEPIPSDDKAMKALQRLYSKWESADDYMTALAMAGNYLFELEGT
jgi:hypothetical protein